MGNLPSGGGSLPKCTEFQAVRGFAILATFFAYAGAILLMSYLWTGNDQVNKAALAMLVAAFVTGIICWGLWCVACLLVACIHLQKLMRRYAQQD